MYNLKMIAILIIVIMCSRCRIHIFDHENYYIQKKYSSHTNMNPLYRRMQILNILCSTCYRLLPSNQQKFYKKKIK